MKIGNIKQQGDISTRNGSDSTNPENPNGESFNITTGSSLSDNGGSINLIVGTGPLANGSINLKSSDNVAIPSLKFFNDGHNVSVRAPDSLSSNVDFILPSQTGTSGQFLKASDSVGNNAWSSIQISDVSSLQTGLDSKIDTVDAVNIQVLQDMYSPTGFVNKDDSTFLFDNSTRTFTIQPAVTDFAVYVDGVKFIKTGIETVTIPNTTGFWFVYYNSSGTLVYSSTAWSLKIHAPVALLYWNATIGELLCFGEERHGVTMDWATHMYLHNVMGTQWRGGLGLSNYTTTGTGNQLADVQMALSNGAIGDEDIVSSITNSASPTPMTFQQTLSPTLTAPVVYNDGNGWRATAFQTHPIITGANGRASYNYYNTSNSTYSLVEAAEGNYFAVWVLAVPNYQSPISFALGPREDSTLDDARNNNVVGDIVATVAPFAELKFLYRLIYQTSNSYTNSVKARLVDVADVRNTDVVKVATSVTTSHSDLSNLGEDDHLQYVHISIPRMITAEHTFSPTTTSAPFILGANAQGQLVTGFNADLLDGFNSTDFQPIDADLTAIAALAGTSGLLKKTAANTWSLDTTNYGTGSVTSIAANAPVAGLTITGSPITTSGTLTFALANDLAAVEGLAGTGFAVRTAADTWANRSVTSANNKITVTNGDGVAGNVSLTINEANFTGIPESAVTGLVTDLANKQPLDADLTAIAALTGTGGFLKTNGSGTWSVDTNTYLTTNQTITLTGDVTGSGTTTIATTLSNTGVTAGSGYNTFTVDAKGRITAASTTAYLTSATGVTTFSGGTTGLTPASATSGAITLAGTLNVANGGTGRATLTANNLVIGNGTTAVSLLAPAGTNSKLRWTGSAYSWAADTLSNITDVTITSPTSGQYLTWNGTAWVNTSLSSSPTSYSIVVSSWTLVSGNLYSATVTHNLGTKNVNVTLYDTANNTIVYPDSIVLTSNNALVLTVTGNTHSINVTVIANGTVVAPSSNAITVQVNGSTLSGTYSTVNFTGSSLSGSSSGGVATVAVSTLQQNTYSATALESPNNSDWAVNLMAPVVNDATYPSLLVRSFTTGSENGVGFYNTIPSGATQVTFSFKGRAATAPGTSSTVILRLYRRNIPNNSAVGAWSAATTIATLTIPTNAFYQYSSVTVSLASLGLTAGSFYEFELTRNGGTLSASAWNMAEMIVEYS